MNTLGERIREERLARGWSQKELARRTGVSKATISAVETDPRRATTVLYEIARALRVRMAYLKDGKGPKTPEPGTGDYVAADSVVELAEVMAAKGPDEVAKLIQLLIEQAYSSSKR